MISEQLKYVRSVTDFEPNFAIVLGSGLGDFAENIDAVAKIPYKDIPNFPISTVENHKGQFVLGYIGKAKVVAMQGRVHLYEGYTASEVVNPIRLMRAMGAKTLFLSNASGGINKNFNVGDLMLIEDHISSFVPSPLIGPNDDDIGPRFPDMSDVYSKKLRKLVTKVAFDNKIKLQKGVYIQLTGPAFETKAEIIMCSALGADAVGMSTAIEAEAGRHCGFDVCGLSCITNYASGIIDKPLTADEINVNAAKSLSAFEKLITKTIEKISDE